MICLFFVPSDWRRSPLTRAQYSPPATLFKQASISVAASGLWDRWDKQGEPIESCTILTCDANKSMTAIHERMPVLIPPESFAAWLDPTERNVSKLLRPFHPDEMTAYPVSTLVNNVRQDSAKCVEPLEVA